MPLEGFAQAGFLRRHALVLVEQAIGATEANLIRLKRLAAGRDAHPLLAMLPDVEARLERLHQQRKRLLAREAADRGGGGIGSAAAAARRRGDAGKGGAGIGRRA